ncbi:MAG: substrate-binding domain-containing protein [Clostridiales Family XIII bacterium]|jgi:phosphate transport system substrate-binding protein|nr:substrate-binding domain-containing protein [Clostridiales Family XIII bacterium]
MRQLRKSLLTLSLIAILTLGMLAGCGGDDGGGDAGSGGTDEPAAGFDAAKAIEVISREDGSGTRTAFIELFGVEVKDDAGNKSDMTTDEAVIAKATDVMMTNVTNNPYAIGYISLGSLNDSVKALEIDGAAASAENVKNGSYGISRPFNIVTKGEAAGLAKDFIAFILSAEGQQVVADGYIAIDDAAAAYAGDKPAGKITVAGSSSVTPIMEKLREAYLAINTGAEIEIQMSDSSAGITGTIDGTCDIGMASRDLKDEEATQVGATQIALDGIAVIVNKENPLTGLAKDQVRMVYTGEATAWGDISA